MENGNILIEEKKAGMVSDYLQSRILHLPDEYTRLLNPHIYKVGISPALFKLRNELIELL